MGPLLLILPSLLIGTLQQKPIARCIYTCFSPASVDAETHVQSECPWPWLWTPHLRQWGRDGPVLKASEEAFGVHMTGFQRECIAIHGWYPVLKKVISVYHLSHTSRGESMRHERGYTCYTGYVGYTGNAGNAGNTGPPTENPRGDTKG